LQIQNRIQTLLTSVAPNAAAVATWYVSKVTVAVVAVAATTLLTLALTVINPLDITIVLPIFIAQVLPVFNWNCH
jgi:hypothetical protein